MKYTKTQIEHVLHRYDQAVADKITDLYASFPVKEQRVKVTVPAEAIEVNVSMSIDGCFYHNRHINDREIRIGTDVPIYTIRDAITDKAIELAKKSAVYKSMSKNQEKIGKFTAFARRNRQILEDALVLGGSDATELMSRFITEINYFK